MSMIGMFVAVAALLAIAGWAVYRWGRKAQETKQVKADAKILEKQRDAASNPRPTVVDDRNSMRNGEF